MTEAEWLVCKDAYQALTALRYGGCVHAYEGGRRRLRLFGCASCRDQWDQMPDTRSRAAVEFMERLADAEELRQRILGIKHQSGNVLLERGWHLNAPDQSYSVTAFDAQHAPRRAAEAAFILLDSDVYKAACADHAMRCSVFSPEVEVKRWRARLRVLADYFRDIFGNPFRLVAFPKSWRTEHTIGIASKMYEDRDFAAMPILADALEEAGCDNADILSHCREPGVHVRGCWVVDLVLGKS